MTKPTEWEGCYDSSWKGFITPESFAHPAKFSRGLIERILDHFLAKGWLKPGETVGDCFGGIGSGGVIAAYRGLQWYGCELEPRFVALAEANFEMHRSRFKALSVPWPRIIQGDSRAFHVLLGGDNAAVVCSPPYADTSGKGGGGINVNGYVPAVGRKWTGDKTDPVGSRTYQGAGGERTQGNIETLPAGSVDGVVCSPPYVKQVHGGNGIDASKLTGNVAGKHSQAHAEGYGQAKGQIENCTPGTVQAVVSSPPYLSGGHHADQTGAWNTNGRGQTQGMGTKESANYGVQPGQIGQENGETYWQAVSAVYQSCYQSLKPGGVIAMVVKDYMKQGKRVPLCDDTARLLEHIGFIPLERIHALLVKQTQHGDLFTGTTTDTTSRKSFFRRLAEKKGSPAIDFEEVLIYQKP